MKKSFLTFAILLSGCTTKIVKPEALAQVHKVAIIGLDLQQQKSVSTGDLIGAALKTNQPSQAVPALRVESNHMEPVYDELAEKLKQTSGWKVLTISEVRKNAAYHELFKKKTEGFQNRPMINDRYTVFAAKGVLDAFAILTVKPEELMELAKALKVDAVVYADATVNLNNNSMFASMVGQGQFHPSSNLWIRVIDARTGEKIYMNSANGPKVENDEKNILGMANEDHMNTLAQSATGLAMDLVLKDMSVKR